jgi:Domain of unknown function (DUF1906)/Putative peptidoglycan binding domain
VHVPGNHVTFGADYSAHELSPAQLHSYTHYDIRFLIRYIGYPGNTKCISHYPGAYHAHVRAGRLVLLVHENDTNDPAGGHSNGVRMAEVALHDAESIGYPGNLPIFFSADGWLGNTLVATAMAYLDGAASVLGRKRTGAYGFRDFIQGAKLGGHAEWLWLAGAAPAPAEVAQGWPHIYQFNNGSINPGGIPADLDWAYPGVLDALRGADPATVPGNGHVPPWPLPPGQYFGLITGPNESHGGHIPADRAWVRLIQQALIRKHYVPGVTDPASPWADGTYTGPTRDAVLRFQHAAGRPATGNVSAADWAVLLA